MIASARLEFPWCKICGERGRGKSVKVRDSEGQPIIFMSLKILQE